LKLKNNNNNKLDWWGAVSFVKICMDFGRIRSDDTDEIGIKQNGGWMTAVQRKRQL